VSAMTEIGTGPAKAQPVAPVPVPTAIGRYHVERVIGTGASGVVYAARHEVLGKPVALKVLRAEWVSDPAQSQRFLREARLAAALTHENIVDITDFGTDTTTGAPYLVMEYLRGTSLRALCAMGPIPWPRVVNILIQLARALACAHADGVLHRDLKPHNIILESSSGRSDLVKLCDFGLSRLLDGGDRITSTGAFIGTPAYMAPEQIRGEVQDERADLYSFGVTAYEMLTGSLPYAATTPVALVAEIVGEARKTLQFPEDVPEPLRDLITRCLARDVAARPRHALDLEGELAAIASLPQAAPTDLVGQTIGNYRVVAPLGSGGSGSVWLAEHPVIGTRCAIKVLRPEVATQPGAFERFINEARAASQIPSPHIARTLDLGRLPGGQPYAVIEYLEGETLHTRIDRDMRLDVPTSIGIARQIASALVEAHAIGIVHRDIKPANVFLVPGSTGPIVKLLDFGIAKLGGPAASGAPKTQMGYFMGTVAYCPPEQLMGLEVGPSADVYALASILFEMLASRPPFTGPVTDIAVKATTEEAPTLGSIGIDVGPGLERLIVSMLAREPSKRPSMPDVLARLEALANGPAPQVPAAGPAPSATAYAAPAVAVEPEVVVEERAPKRRAWIARVAIVAVAVIAVWWLWPDDKKPTPRAATPAAATTKPAAPTFEPIAPPPKDPPPAPTAATTTTSSGATMPVAPSTPSAASTTVSNSTASASPSSADSAKTVRTKSTDSRKSGSWRDKTTKPDKGTRPTGDVIIADPFGGSP